MTAQAMAPLRVTAHLAGGIAHTGPWGIALDGLLASLLWSEHKAARREDGAGYMRAMDSDVVPDLDLPLARCRPESGPWHWAATCAHPAEGAVTEAHQWTSSIDARDLEHLSAKLPKVVSARQGRYRNRIMPVLVTLTPAVTWHAVGEPGRITELLTPVRALGKKHAVGEGHVLAWEITPAPDIDDLAAAHLHPDGSLGRPTPDACLHRISTQVGQVPGGGRGMAGIRPPYMHPSRQHDLHLPALLDA